jgi:hypothetical protein
MTARIMAKTSGRGDDNMEALVRRASLTCPRRASLTCRKRGERRKQLLYRKSQVNSCCIENSKLTVVVYETPSKQLLYMKPLSNSHG